MDEKKTAVEKKPIGKTRGEHSIQVYVSHEMKERLRGLSVRYDRTTADITRAVLRVGIPLFEGMSDAEEVMVREYMEMFRKLRRVRSLKEV